VEGIYDKVPATKNLVLKVGRIQKAHIVRGPMNGPMLDALIFPHRAKNTKGRHLITDKTLIMSKYRTARAVIPKARWTMGEIKGMIDKIDHGMLSPPTRKITESVKTAIVRVSEGITKTRDKLPLVNTTRMNDPPNALNTEADSGLHTDVVKPKNGAAPTNNKPINSKVMLTDPRANNTTPSDTRRNANEVMGSPRGLVTTIVTLGKVRNTAETGAPTRGSYEHEYDRERQEGYRSGEYGPSGGEYEGISHRHRDEGSKSGLYGQRSMAYGHGRHEGTENTPDTERYNLHGRDDNYSGRRGYGGGVFNPTANEGSNVEHYGGRIEAYGCREDSEDSFGFEGLNVQGRSEELLGGMKAAWSRATV